MICFLVVYCTLYREVEREKATTGAVPKLNMPSRRNQPLDLAELLFKDR